MSKHLTKRAATAATLAVMTSWLFAGGVAKAEQAPLADATASQDGGGPPEAPAMDGTLVPPEASREDSPDAGLPVPSAETTHETSSQSDAGLALPVAPMEDLSPVRHQPPRVPELAAAAGLPLLGGLLAVPCVAGPTVPLFACGGLGVGATIVCSIASVGICVTWPCLVFPAVGGALGLTPAAIPLAFGWLQSAAVLALLTWNAAPNWKTAVARLAAASVGYLAGLAVLGAAIAPSVAALVLYRAWRSTTRSSTSPIAGIAGHVAGAASWPLAVLSLLLTGTATIMLLAAPVIAVVALWMEHKFNHKSK